MAKSFRTRLRSGEQLLGTLVTLASPEVVEILVDAGYDWLFIDCEHAPFDAVGAQPLLQAAADRCACVIRVPVGDEVWIKKALDIGAAGIIAPQVNSPEQAERIVKLCKYPPEGTRGVGIARAHRYGYGFQDYLGRANQDIAVILQAEHVQAVENIDAIVKVPGIDAILIGPYDLSASMGRIGQVTDPVVQKAIKKVTKACRGARIPLGAFGVSAKAVTGFIKSGFNLIAVGADVLFLGGAAKETLSKLR
jgi:2-keto-3-deoxy-L-rhamnonate aldolase RhmA